MKAGDIRAALKRHFAAPECAVVFEVAQGTGFAAQRHLDAVAMELWPSRGLALYGIEIKVSMYDWRREKANPEKAEQIARFCDEFYIAAPACLIPVSELPSAWGLLEVSADGQVTIPKRATRTDAEPVTRAFMAAMLRAATRPTDATTLDGMLAQRRRAMDQDFEERVNREAERVAGRRSRDAENWQKLAAAIGLDQQHRLGLLWGDPDLAAAAKAVLTSGAASSWQGLASLANTLAEFQERLQGAMQDLGLEPPAPQRKRKRRRAA